MPANFENSAVATGLERSVFIPTPKKGNAKGCSNYCTIEFISHASKVMLKILQARLQHYVNWKLPDVQAGFRKRQRNQRSNCQHPLDHRKSKRVSERHLCLLHWFAKDFHCVEHNKLWKILQEVWIPDHFTCLLRNLYAGQEATVRTRHDKMNRFKIGRGVHQGCVWSPCLFTKMESTECKILGWMKHKLESRLLGEISITSDTQMILPLWKKVKRS